MASFQVLRDETGADAGLVILQALNGGQAEHVLLRDPGGDLEDPTNVVSLTQGFGTPLGLSPDLRFVVTAAPGSKAGLGILHLDGSGRTCTLTTTPGAALLDPAFPAGSRLVFWSERLEPSTKGVEGWVASPIDCTLHKRRFATGLNLIFQMGSDQLVYSYESDGSRVDIAQAPLEDDSRLGQAAVVAQQVGRLFWVLPQRKAMLVHLDGANSDIDGVYFRSLP